MQWNLPCTVHMIEAMETPFHHFWSCHWLPGDWDLPFSHLTQTELSQQLVEHTHPRQNLMRLLTDFYMQLTLSTDICKWTSCLPTNRVRLNKGYFGLRSDLQVSICNNTTGGGSMPPDHPSYCMISMAQYKTPQKVNKLFVWGYEMQTLKGSTVELKLTSGDHIP